MMARTLAKLLAGIAAIGLLTSTAGLARCDDALLELPDDGSLSGTLLPVAGTEDGPTRTLLWKSPLFETPFTFPVGAVRGVRFPTPTAALPREAWRVCLVDGDMLIGDLTGIDAATITLAGAAGQPVTIDRRLIAVLERTEGGSHTTIVATDSLASWEQSSAESWRASPDGLAPLKWPATIDQDVGIPERARCDVTLSVAKKASFRLAVAASPTNHEADPFRLELLAGQEQPARLVLVRKEVEAARIAEIDASVLAGGRLVVTLFIDQKGGRIIATVPATEGRQVVTDLTMPPTAGRTPSGLMRITAVKGDLTFESIRISPWTTPEPTPNLAPETLVTRDQGTLERTAVESFTAASGSLSVVHDGQSREIPLASVSAIAFPRPSATEPPAAEAAAQAPASGHRFAVTAQGGQRLTGAIVRIDDDAVWLRRDGIEGDVAIRRADLLAMRRLGPLAAIDKLPGRSGTLSSAGTRCAGCVTPDAAVTGPSHIAWWPKGSENSSRFADRAEVDAVVDYRPPAAKNGSVSKADFPARLILRSGDAIPCVVTSLDERGIGVVTPAQPTGDGGAVVVPAALVQAVELMPAAPSRGLEKTRVERLLTLPRSQRADPPQHILRLENGDYLRGTVTSLDADVLRVKVMGSMRTVPLRTVARVIWLTPPEAPPASDPSPAEPPAVDKQPPTGMLLRAIAADGRRITLTASGMDGSLAVGESAALGPCRIDLRQLDRLQIGRAVERDVITPPYSQWKLKHAPEPRVLREAAGNAG